jgi:hypothetical protein
MATLTTPKQPPLSRYLLLAVLLSILVAMGRYHLISEDLEERSLETVTPIVIALDKGQPNPTATPRRPTPTQARLVPRYPTATPMLTRSFAKPLPTVPPQTRPAPRYSTTTPTLARPSPKPTDTPLSLSEFNPGGKGATMIPTTTPTPSPVPTPTATQKPTPSPEIAKPSPQSPAVEAGNSNRALVRDI